MTTATEIINRSLRTIGVLASGETATADQASDALVSLNDVVAGLSNESLAIFANTQDSLPMDGSTSYTFGTGGNLNSARPVKLLSVFYRTTDGLDFPVDMITQDEYNAIGLKTLSGTIPSKCFYDPSYPLGTIYLWGQPDTGTLEITSNKQIVSIPTLATNIALPIGYDRLLRYALAVELMPEYGVNDQNVVSLYMSAKADLKRTNTSVNPLRVSLPFGGGAVGGYPAILMG